MRQIIRSTIAFGVCTVLFAVGGCGGGSNSGDEETAREDRESSGTCPGGEFSLTLEATEGDCSSGVVRNIKQNIYDQEMAEGPCGETWSPAPRNWYIGGDGEPYIELESHHFVSGPRTRDGFEPGEMTVDVERYASDFPSPDEEPVEECVHEFTVEFAPL